jgi:hypothetical protein
MIQNQIPLEEASIVLLHDSAQRGYLLLFTSNSPASSPCALLHQRHVSFQDIFMVHPESSQSQPRRPAVLDVPCILV